MIIGIDASRANKHKKTGVEWYSYHLIQQLKKIDTENRYFLYTNKPLRGELGVCPPNFEERVLKWFLPRFWTLGRLSLEMKFPRLSRKAGFGKENPDVLFVPAHTIPFFNPKRSVVTVHDIGFEHFPKLYKWPDKFYHRFTIRFIKRFADKIITISNYSKKDISEFYGISEEKIIVIPISYDKDEFKVIEGAKILVKDKFNIDYPYLFFIGRLEEKKNIPRLIESFGVFKQNNPNSNHKLVLAGKPGFGYERVKENIEKYTLRQAQGDNFQNDVVFLDWVPSKDLPLLYNAADLFVFPSLFEGFGIPPLEAMACGCPVICSNTTSLPEVVGEAALMFDPLKVSEIVSRMEQVLFNTEVADSLRIKGLERVKYFSWEKCAKETLNVLIEQ